MRHARNGFVWFSGYRSYSEYRDVLSIAYAPDKAAWHENLVAKRQTPPPLLFLSKNKMVFGRAAEVHYLKIIVGIMLRQIKGIDADVNPTVSGIQPVASLCFYGFRRLVPFAIYSNPDWLGIWRQITNGNCRAHNMPTCHDVKERHPLTLDIHKEAGAVGRKAI